MMREWGPPFGPSRKLDGFKGEEAGNSRGKDGKWADWEETADLAMGRSRLSAQGWGKFAKEATPFEGI